MLDTSDNNCDYLGIDRSNGSAQWSLSPNPFSQELTIDFGGVQTEVEILVINAIGGMVYSNKNQKAAKLKLELDTPPGMYYIQVNNREHTETFKVIKL